MDIPNFDDMIINLMDNMPDLMRFVTALSYLIGITLIGNCVYTLKQYGDMRTMQSSPNDFRGPAVMFILGAMLLYFPSTVTSGIETFWGEGSNILEYQPPDNSSESIMLDAIITIMQVIGAISFIRGLTILSKTGMKSGQPGQFGKGLAHCIAGIMALNLYATWEMLLATFGVEL